MIIRGGFTMDLINIRQGSILLIQSKGEVRVVSVSMVGKDTRGKYLIEGCDTRPIRFSMRNVLEVLTY